MLGRHDAGAGAGLEPASEPEPLPAAGRAAPEHCCRGGRSSGYWAGASALLFCLKWRILRANLRDCRKTLLAE
jgi:hypothetical protein